MVLNYTNDAPISEKIKRMKQRVCWQNEQILTRNIDQSRLSLDDSGKEDLEFSFLVIGDTGWGPDDGYYPQRHIAKEMLPHLKTSRFLLHTGDVIYNNGSAEYYPQNFIEPYREWLVGGDHPQNIPYDKMTFNFPFLPVLGNHDYYEITPELKSLLQLGKFFIKDSKLPDSVKNVGLEGSNCGEAYAKAFIDCLEDLDPKALATHLDRHYSAVTDTGLCLEYQPGKFSRIPNNYYRFEYGGIDFFALDSSTIAAYKEEEPDWKQLNWLKDQLIHSWYNKNIRGRIIYCHHPAYSTEITKWKQKDTLAMRRYLNLVIQEVVEKIEYLPEDGPLVNLFVTGHAHSLEYLQIQHKGFSNLNCHLNFHWLVCGGSGCSARRQHVGDVDELEIGADGETKLLAQSKLFVGLSGFGKDKKYSYSFARIDIKGNQASPQIFIRPFVSQWYQGKWYDFELETIKIL